MLAALLVGGGVARGFERLGAALRGEKRGEIGDLTRLQGKKLVAGLGRLKRAGRRLAGADDVRHRRLRAFDIADHTRLDAQRILEAADAVPPALAGVCDQGRVGRAHIRSEEHTSELQSLMRISYAVFCLKKKKK